MRTTSTTAATAALACLLVGAAATGCTDGSSAEKRSADRMLDDANGAMRTLKSVTIDATGNGTSSRLTTDLKGRCAFRTTAAKGAVLEQIRIGKTDYVRPNRAYLEAWRHQPAGATEQKRWIKTPSSNSEPGDGLAECTQPFASYGKATKGEPTKVNGTPAISLLVTDEAAKDGTFTFYIATEGKPYILKVAYKGPDFVTTTTYSAFDKPLNVRPPAKADVLDMSGTG
ncbi:hypothetical protein [Streptomyces sp. NBC_01465]|uniref:hypothetical protein n=1 Tax=Streptomyces sp. NBC_01465 TaxID=2903878 RepID=UPI002E3262EC|nr:hypothetical protein [Streptomyces sp. NBC_01465]